MDTKDAASKTDCSTCEFEKNQEIIRQIAFFQGLPTDLVKGLAYFSGRLNYKQGELLCEQNSVDDKAYCLLSGEAEIIRSQDGEELRAGSFVAGDFFGGLALTTDVSRLFSVRAVSDVTCLVIRRKSLLSNLAKSPEFATALLAAASRRVVEWDEQRIRMVREKGTDLANLGVSLI